ncbi:hypothetical protein J7412_06335 [Shimia sp. R9_3]|nr:hypothetical protein [Shimia sp. R9_3]
MSVVRPVIVQVSEGKVYAVGAGGASRFGLPFGSATQRCERAVRAA